MKFELLKAVVGKDGSICDNQFLSQISFFDKNIILSYKNEIEYEIRVCKIDEDFNEEILFRIKAGANTLIKPTSVDKNGMIYFGTDGEFPSKDNIIYCLYPDGQIKWKYKLTGTVHGKIVFDKSENIIFFENVEAKPVHLFNMLSINRDGELNWINNITGVNNFEPVIVQDGTIFCCVGSKICSWDKVGQFLFSKPVGSSDYIPATITEDRIYLNVCLPKETAPRPKGWVSKIKALDLEGCLLWEYESAKGNAASTPVVDNNGNCYFYVAHAMFVSLDHDGELRWRTDIKGGVCTAPLFIEDKYILVQSTKVASPVYLTWLELFDLDGNKHCEYQLDGNIMSCKLYEGYIYVLTEAYIDGTGTVENNYELDCYWKLHKVQIIDDDDSE